MDRIFYVSEDTYLLTSYIQIGTRFYYILILLHFILVPCEVCNTLNFSLCKIAMKSKHLLVVCFALFLIFITDCAPLQTKKLITVMMGGDFWNSCVDLSLAKNPPPNIFPNIAKDYFCAEILKKCHFWQIYDNLFKWRKYVAEKNGIQLKNI